MNCYCAGSSARQFAALLDSSLVDARHIYFDPQLRSMMYAGGVASTDDHAGDIHTRV
jgi:hypothetical protein